MLPKPEIVWLWLWSGHGLKTKLSQSDTILPFKYHTSAAIFYVGFLVGSLWSSVFSMESTKEILKQRLDELSDMLLSQNYNENIVKAAIQKAESLDRLEALKKVVKYQTNRVILAICYHLCLTSVSTVVNTHWNTMTQDPTLKKVFSEPPLLAFKQPPNLRSMFIRAKLPTKSRPSRVNIGTHTCGKQCKVWSYINTANVIKSNVTKEVVKYKGDFSCKTVGVVYLISCTKCRI